MRIIVGLPYLGVLGLMYAFLTVKVVLGRKKFRIGIGTGQNSDMARAVRVHGNFMEYVPLISIMLVALELNFVPIWLLHMFWISLVLGRVAHAQGLGGSAGVSPGRFGGMLLTLFPLIGAAITMLIIYF